jgi:putative FmdB family regulatory protein
VPTYQYVCTACDTPLEAVQSFSDAALTECPTCGGTLRKVYGAVGVVFKGSGFYKTDSRAGKTGDKGSDGAKSDAPKADAPNSDGPKTDAPKTESAKPAAAPAKAASA